MRGTAHKHGDGTHCLFNKAHIKPVLYQQARRVNIFLTAFSCADALKLRLNHVGMFTAARAPHQQHCIAPSATTPTQHSFTKATQHFQPHNCLKFTSNRRLLLNSELQQNH
mmetsp:Transcript_64549/g.134613  ORF Transcript_64549/g.134613 Transcript_64549/m.134613 type:complete len:111 (+) Transcript_64549:235-567(+)